jgi:membrane associated rhomboid family serine protease
MPPLTPVVKNLLIVNIAVFVILALVMPALGMSENYARNVVALHYPSSPDFAPYQLVTHFFVHGGFTHLFLNMFGLFMFGPLLERRYGGGRFLLLYLVAAAGAVALHFGYTWYEIGRYEELMRAYAADPRLATFNDFFTKVNIKALVMDDGTSLSRIVADTQSAIVRQSADPANIQQGALALMQEYIDYIPSIPMVGASGAIYGIVAAFALLYPDFRLMLIFLPIPIRARYFVPFMLGVDLFLGIMQFSWDPIAHWAHLGGALAGGLLAYYWYRTDPPEGAQRWDRGVPR